MSRSRLRFYVWTGAVSLIVFALIYIATQQYLPKSHWPSTLGNLIPLAVAVPAVFLAAAFARRNSYLQALRDFWGRLVPTAQAVIQYTYITSPTQQDFANVQVSLSTAIDDLRGVFANLPRPDDPIGLYPYENLKDIKHVIDWLGYGNGFRAEEVPEARRCIIKLWRAMHNAMLSEFDRDVPEVPLSKYLSNGVSEADQLIQRSRTPPKVRRPTPP